MKKIITFASVVILIATLVSSCAKKPIAKTNPKITKFSPKQDVLWLQEDLQYPPPLEYLDKMDSAWQRFSIDIDKIYPTWIYYVSKDGKDTCKIQPTRMVIDSVGYFQLFTIIYDEKNFDFPKNRILTAEFQGGQKERIFYADSCVKYDCRNNNWMSYEDAASFCRDVQEALELHLSKEKAFAYAMKKRNWY